LNQIKRIRGEKGHPIVNLGAKRGNEKRMKKRRIRQTVQGRSLVRKISKETRSTSGEFPAQIGENNSGKRNRKEGQEPLVPENQLGKIALKREAQLRPRIAGASPNPSNNEAKKYHKSPAFR